MSIFPNYGSEPTGDTTPRMPRDRDLPFSSDGVSRDGSPGPIKRQLSSASTSIQNHEQHPIYPSYPTPYPPVSTTFGPDTPATSSQTSSSAGVIAQHQYPTPGTQSQERYTLEPYTGQSPFKGPDAVPYSQNRPSLPERGQSLPPQSQGYIWPSDMRSHPQSHPNQPDHPPLPHSHHPLQHYGPYEQQQLKDRERERAREKEREREKEKEREREKQERLEAERQKVGDTGAPSLCQPGDVLKGRWKILSRIGNGAFGTFV